MRGFYLLTVSVLLLFLDSACVTIPKGSFDANQVPPAPDYSNMANWAALPSVQDAADRVPSRDLEDRQEKAAVDVFFLHPTTYTRKKGNREWNAHLDNTQLNADTDSSTILHQASIFNAAGKVYAPRYRQAHLHSFYEKKRLRDAAAALDLAYEDVRAAFSYYLENYNQGRPIMIASHSQGTTHAKQLIKEFFDGKPLQKQLVAAYLVGMPVYPNDFQNIPICDQPDQTGCFVSWRTYRHDFKVPEELKDTTTALAVNPLNWSGQERVIVPKTNSRGAIYYNYDKGYQPNAIEAEIRYGAVFTSKPKFPFSFLFNTRNYHIADYNLFWLDVRENASTRVSSYLEDN